MKTLILFVTAFTFNSIVLAQLPTVNAAGHGDVYVNWKAEKANEDPDGPGFFLNTCAQGVTPISASSTLAPQGNFNYGIDNLNDHNPMTAWSEGARGYGVGESFTVKASVVNLIHNGYQHTIQAWKDNSRVKKFKVYVNGEAICYLVLEDIMGGQSFELTGADYDWENPKTFKFEIVEVYKGLKWDDVCISHIDHMACCFAQNTTILVDNVSIKVPDIEKEDFISSLNLETSQIQNVIVLKTTTQKHVSLIKIKTKSSSIEITKDHPVYVKDYGFISMNRLLLKMELSSYEELEGKVELMIWDELDRSTKFEKLEKTTILEGLVDTYSIQELSEGNTFIANGFVTKTY